MYEPCSLFVIKPTKGEIGRIDRVYAPRHRRLVLLYTVKFSILHEQQPSKFLFNRMCKVQGSRCAHAQSNNVVIGWCARKSCCRLYLYYSSTVTLKWVKILTPVADVSTSTYVVTVRPPLENRLNTFPSVSVIPAVGRC